MMSFTCASVNCSATFTTAGIATSIAISASCITARIFSSAGIGICIASSICICIATFFAFACFFNTIKHSFEVIRISKFNYNIRIVISILYSCTSLFKKLIVFSCGIVVINIFCAIAQIVFFICIFKH